MYPVPKPPAETLPTMYDLPSEDPEEPGLPDEFHDFQPQLLRETFRPPHLVPTEIFIGTDLNLYYDGRHPQWHKRPDWFLVLGVTRAEQQQDLRWSYVVWQEGVNPFLVVELLSPGTEAEDLGQTLRAVNRPPTKWQVYEQVLRIPYYVVFDRYENQLRVFQLVATQYQEMSVPDQRFWLPEVDLGLGVWRGSYEGTIGAWLRWYDGSGQWLSTAAEQAVIERERAEMERERAETERERAEMERERAEMERERADRLAEKLRELGIDPEQG
jgi:Uma2 family endonuclease